MRRRPRPAPGRGAGAAATLPARAPVDRHGPCSASSSPARPSPPSRPERARRPAPFAQVDVSRAQGLQAEVAIAADPENDQVLLAGSNSIERRGRSYSRVYASSDGGASWTSTAGPPALQDGGEPRCSLGDPTVAIGRGGTQYYGFLSAPCSLVDPAAGAGGAGESADPGERLGPKSPRVALEVASRAGPAGAWRTRAVFPVRSFRFDDKPALAVDSSPTSPHADRVYVAWSKSVLTGPRGKQSGKTEIAVAWSDDRGAVWSRPVAASGGDRHQPPVFASLALDRGGTVYLAWTDANQQIWLDRSADGGATWGRDLLVDSARGLPGPPCDTGGVAIRAQQRRCITPTPTVLVDDRDGEPVRVFVTYSAPGADGYEQDVFVASYDASLAPLLGPRTGARKQVSPPDRGFASDQFMPAAAIDRSSGRLWVCWYDSGGDRSGRRVRFTCSASADGGATWTGPVGAASATSNMTVRRASSFQFGDYQGLAVANGVAHPIWTDSRALGTLQEEIFTTVLTDADVGLQPAQ